MRNQLRLVRPAPVIFDAVDLYAGAGGTTEGATRTRRVRVVAAVNHNELALLTHQANHPKTLHLREDVSVVNPHFLRKFISSEQWLLLASPACTGHTWARGKDMPEHDVARMTANGVIHVASVMRPDLLLVENVKEMLEWMPPPPEGSTKAQRKAWKKKHLVHPVLVYEGGRPVEKLAGPIFVAWMRMLEAHGYHLTLNLLDAARFGVPQNRVRLVIAGSLHRQLPPIEYPRGVELVPVSTVIEWDTGTWRPIKEKVAATQARWARGRKAFGQRFIMPYYGSGSGETGRSLDRPCGTVPAADVWSVVDGRYMRVFTPRELLKVQSFDPDYILHGTRADVTKQIGNAVPPLLAEGYIRQTLTAGHRANIGWAA